MAVVSRSRLNPVTGLLSEVSSRITPLRIPQSKGGMEMESRRTGETDPQYSKREY